MRAVQLKFANKTSTFEVPEDTLFELESKPPRGSYIGELMKGDTRSLDYSLLIA